MKKLVLFTTMLLLILGLAGCSKEEKSIDADEVTTNTLLAKSNGELQVATVEDFDKSYYNISELKQFITKEIDTYNQKAGADKIVVNSVEQSGNQAIMLLTYSGMDQYASFNKTTAAYFNGGISKVGLDLPTTLVNSKNGSLASTQEAIQNTKYKVLVLNEPYDVIVEGSIKYYSENAEPVDDNEIKSAADGMTVIVFK